MSTAQSLSPSKTSWSATASRLRAKGNALRTVPAEWLWQHLPADGSTVTLWQSFGHVAGSERFGRTPMRRGEEEIIAENGKGRVVVRYPLLQGRTVRIAVAA